MIDSERCETCECWERIYGPCGKCGCNLKISCDEDEICADWEPKHGEWISMEQCKPEDGDHVVIGYDLEVCEYDKDAEEEGGFFKSDGSLLTPGRSNIG